MNECMCRLYSTDRFPVFSLSDMTNGAALPGGGFDKAVTQAPGKVAV